MQASSEHFASHEDSTAQTATERELEFALDEHETTELASVDTALARIEAGTYGMCITYGTHIPLQRLNVAPHLWPHAACLARRMQSMQNTVNWVAPLPAQ